MLRANNVRGMMELSSRVRSGCLSGSWLRSFTRLSKASWTSQLFMLAGSEAIAEVARPEMYASSLRDRLSSDVILQQVGVIDSV